LAKDQPSGLQGVLEMQNQDADNSDDELSEDESTVATNKSAATPAPDNKKDKWTHAHKLITVDLNHKHFLISWKL